MNSKYAWFYRCFFIAVVCLATIGTALKAQQLVDSILFESDISCGIDYMKNYESFKIVAISYSGLLNLGQEVVGPSSGIDCMLICYDEDNQMLWNVIASSGSNDQTTDVLIDTLYDRVFWSFLFWDAVTIGDSTVTVENGSRASLTVGIDIATGLIDFFYKIEGNGQKRMTTSCIDTSGRLTLFGHYSGEIVLDDTVLSANDNDRTMLLLQFDKHDGPMTPLVKSYETTGQCRPQTCVSDGQNIYVGGTISGFVVVNNDTLRGRLLDTDIFLVKFDDDMRTSWYEVYSEVYNKSLTDMVFHAGELIVAGTFMGPLRFRDGLEIRTMGLNFDGFVAVIDADGFASFAHNITGNGFIENNRLYVQEDEITVTGNWTNGDLVFLNDTVTTSNFNSQGFVAQYNRSLQPLDIQIIETDGFVNSVWYDKTNRNTDVYALNFSQPFTVFDFTGSSQSAFAGYLLEFEPLPVGLDPLSEIVIEHIRVYPNPVHTVLYLDVDDQVEFTIIDIHGKIHGRGTAAGSIDVSHLIPQAYILQLSKQGRPFHPQRIIKL